MTRFGSISELLDDLSPQTLADEPAWADILARAELLSVSPGGADGRVTQSGGLSWKRGRLRLMRGMRRRPLLVALMGRSLCQSYSSRECAREGARAQRQPPYRRRRP